MAKKCNSCNIEFGDNAKFCMECGEKLIECGNKDQRLLEMIFVKGSDNSCELKNGKIVFTKIKDFYIGKYPVTQMEFDKIMGMNPSCFNGKKRPVETVSWYEAMDFCNKLSEREGFEKCFIEQDGEMIYNCKANGYRLPTKAEWIFAAKGGENDSDYLYSGSDELDEVGWFEDNSGGETHTVGELKPNELGIHDMSGNLGEWTCDYEGSGFVCCGGCWLDSEEMCEVNADMKAVFLPEERMNYIGFRVARRS
jgi:formylglycine-generating enzyme